MKIKKINKKQAVIKKPIPTKIGVEKVKQIEEPLDEVEIEEDYVDPFQESIDMFKDEAIIENPFDPNK